MNDIAKANRIIDLYASRDDWSMETCEREGYTLEQSQVLVDVLGPGREGLVTEPEGHQLEMAGFSREFIKELRGDDGFNALTRRLRWLTDLGLTLGEFQETIPVALPHLVDDLSDNNPEVRIHSARILSRAGSVAFPALIQALSDENDEVRILAVGGLIGTKDRTAVPALIRALSDKTTDVRSFAARALGIIGDPSAVPALSQKVLDSSCNVRVSVTGALGAMGAAAAEAVPKLIDLLSYDHPKDIEIAARALMEIGPAAAPAVPLLSQALSHKERKVRLISAEALKSIGSAANNALPYLERMAKEDPDSKCRKMAQSAVDTIIARADE